MTDNPSAETARAWHHTRKGRIAGVVAHEDADWITIRCTEPNRQADTGETLTFRRSLAREVSA